MLVDGGWGGDLGTEDAKRHRKLDTAGAGEPGGTERCQGAADARGTGSVPVPGRAAGPRAGRMGSERWAGACLQVRPRRGTVLMPLGSSGSDNFASCLFINIFLLGGLASGVTCGCQAAHCRTQGHCPQRLWGL